jgi:phosphoglucosamine mutase
VPIDERKENRDVFCKENPEIISSGASENRADFAAESIGIYEEHLCSFGADFSGLRIGLDCANGAAFATAPRVFRRLGAEVFTIGTEPDGENINRGIGSTNISALMNFVVENELDLGFAFDGDGDRCITVNRNGQVLDGDCEMLNLALDLLSRGELKGGKIALTVMSNLGLLRELEAYGIGAEICPVGDRFVAEKMRELGLRLGGEQSGHIIIGDEVTGDGILTAICLTRIFSERGFLWKFLPTPQVSENVSVREKGRIMRDERLSFLLRELENSLHGEGRILLRPSGTENLIRIMVEHQNTEKCKLIVSKIGNLVRKIDEEEIL